MLTSLSFLKEMDVSIIIPAKNRLWALPKAVDSCRSSSLKVQIIVVDDASADGTWEWLAKQPDVTAIRGEGWGKPWGVNKALPLANGKYLRYLDSDDWLNAGANETQFEIAEREQADLVVAGVNNYQEEILAETQPWIPTDDFIAQQLGESIGSHYSAFLFRREFIKDIPHRTLFPASDFASRDDRCLMLEVAIRQPKIAVSPMTTLCHRHHSMGRLQFRGKLQAAGSNIQHLYIYKHILKLLERRGELTLRRKKAACKALWPLARWISRHDLECACEVADWVRILNPEFSNPENGLLGQLYKRAGFRATEQLLALRRWILLPFR
jgi:glycosyltransferase involved in cell wall biosynthesis